VLLLGRRLLLHFVAPTSGDVIPLEPPLQALTRCKSLRAFFYFVQGQNQKKILSFATLKLLAVGNQFR
jgi:hypothetical protein